MTAKRLARAVLWDIAAEQRGFVTSQQSTDAVIDKHALQMLVHWGTLDRAAHGVYRFPQFRSGSTTTSCSRFCEQGCPKPLRHRAEVEVYLAEQEREGAQVQERIEAEYPLSDGLRAKLLARPET